MAETIVIHDRFRGPPQSGNGGYVAGAFAELLDIPEQDVEVTLRSPIPLDKPLQVVRHDGLLTIMDGDTLIAEVKPADVDLDIPELPAWDKVRAAESASFSFMDKINPLLPGTRGFHPICFCCGADHEDGLNVYAAPIEDANQVAAVWETSPDWGDEEGLLPAAFLWTALDCPGQFAYYATGIKTGMLGRITAKLFHRPRAGETLLVTAWPVSVDGKKHFAGSAIHRESGELIGRALSVWIGRMD